MMTLMISKMTRREFIKKTAETALILGVVPYIPGCSHHDNNGNNLEGNTWVGIDNPFNGITIGDSYLINGDSLSHAKSAFDIEELAKLTYPMSKSEDVEVITTTNRASRTEDDFSLGVAATAKAKFGIGAGSLSNTYNKSKSKVHAENTLTWTSRDVRTGQVISVLWGKYKYTDFYGCLLGNAQQKLAQIFDYYGQTVALIEARKTNTDEGKAVFAKYLSAVKNWYDSYGYGFVSGVWVGMLGKADLTITSTMTNTTSKYSNSTSVSYSTPVAGGGLNVAVSGLSADYKKEARGAVVIAVMPANTEMMNWKSSWVEKFSGKLGSITDMLTIDPSPSAYTGTEVKEPTLESPSAKVVPSVSEKFQVTDLDGAKACAQVLDWEKKGQAGESFEQYLVRKENEKKAVAKKFEGKDQGNFEDNVKNIVESNAVSLVKTDMALLQVDSDLNSSSSITPWADFMNQWTTLGVYITRWSDVIPALTQAADVSATDGDMTSGLVYLWGVRYQTELTRFADYIDTCYPYAVTNAWKTQATNIISFGNQIRGFTKAFETAMKDKLDYAKTNPAYTSQQFYEDLIQTKSGQITQMLIPKMYECWSANYEFFKQADFGCGLVMMPGGIGTVDPQFIFAGMNGINCSTLGGFRVDWMKSNKDSVAYLNTVDNYANLPKILPLISINGKIMFLLIGTNKEEGAINYGILDAGMMSLYRDGYAFTVDALTKADNESRVFIAEGVSKTVIDYFHTAWFTSNIQGNSLYKDPSTSDSFYLMSFSALSSGGAILNGVLCSAKTTFYLVPLSGFTDGTKVRGVKISDELPDIVANPFKRYSKNTAETLLEDTPSAVYGEGVTRPTSTDDNMDIVLNDYRVWKGLLPAPE